MSYKQHKRHTIMLGEKTNETQQNREKLISNIMTTSDHKSAMMLS